MAMWTAEMREEMDRLMDTACGGDWVEDGITEEELESCCEMCPFRARCLAESNFVYGCAVWEELAGEDV